MMVMEKRQATRLSNLRALALTVSMLLGLSAQPTYAALISDYSMLWQLTGVPLEPLSALSSSSGGIAEPGSDTFLGISTALAGFGDGAPAGGFQNPFGRQISALADSDVFSSGNGAHSARSAITPNSGTLVYRARSETRFVANFRATADGTLNLRGLAAWTPESSFLDTVAGAALLQIDVFGDLAGPLDVVDTDFMLIGASSPDVQSFNVNLAVRAGDLVSVNGSLSSFISVPEPPALLSLGLLVAILLTKRCSRTISRS